MRLNLRRNIYMNEICDAAGVSERGLRYAFEDLFGLRPTVICRCCACALPAAACPWPIPAAVR
jgi:AraC family ethanolamine operon transcriptional activator